MVTELVRTPEAGPEDRLEFKEGVNVVVGPPNTGKTKWLQMLDFVLGNDGIAEEVFGEDIAEKYETITARFVVAGEELEVPLDRLEFEKEQLKATLAEANEMVVSLQAESERLSAELASDHSQMATLRNMLRPIHSAAALGGRLPGAAQADHAERNALPRHGRLEAGRLSLGR